jgi:hypothetical protein
VDARHKAGHDDEGQWLVSSAASLVIPRSLDRQVERFLSSLLGLIEEATLQRSRIPRNSLTSGKAVEDHA